MPNFLVHVDQRFPTGGSRNSGVRNAIFEGGSWYVLGSTFLQMKRNLGNLACPTTEKNITQLSYSR